MHLCGLRWGPPAPQPAPLPDTSLSAQVPRRLTLGCSEARVRAQPGAASASALIWGRETVCSITSPAFGSKTTRDQGPWPHTPAAASTATAAPLRRGVTVTSCSLPPHRLSKPPTVLPSPWPGPHAMPQTMADRKGTTSNSSVRHSRLTRCRPLCGPGPRGGFFSFWPFWVTPRPWSLPLHACLVLPYPLHPTLPGSLLPSPPPASTESA